MFIAWCLRLIKGNRSTFLGICPECRVIALPTSHLPSPKRCDNAVQRDMLDSLISLVDSEVERFVGVPFPNPPCP